MVTPCGRILALVTCKRLATVHKLMCFEVRSICRRIVAKVTHMRLLSSVNENVPLELRRCLEGLVTLGTVAVAVTVCRLNESARTF